MGLARTGAVGHNSSGDIFLAFSTANREAFTAQEGLVGFSHLHNNSLDPLFTATVEAVEEAVLDSLFVNETMTGRDGNRSIALPQQAVLDLLRHAGRL
jgi:L-aminopeptidase/D-esterase-like protein